jgi:hypothetical protein
MSKTLGLLVFIGIAAALLAAPSSRGRTDDAVKNAREVDLVTMAKVYAQNENRGHKAYRGRWVRVGATATRIGETLWSIIGSVGTLPRICLFLLSWFFG